MFNSKTLLVIHATLSTTNRVALPVVVLEIREANVLDACEDPVAIFPIEYNFNQT